MAVKKSKERVTIVLDKELLAKLDAFAAEAKTSRSSLLSQLIESAFMREHVEKRASGNKFVEKALELIFGDGGDSAANSAADTIRKSILRQIKQLSVLQAEEEIGRDLGLPDGDDSPDNLARYSRRRDRFNADNIPYGHYP